jgi:hypothetical protein
VISENGIVGDLCKLDEMEASMRRVMCLIVAAMLINTCPRGYAQNGNPDARTLVLKVQRALGDGDKLRQVKSIHNVLAVVQKTPRGDQELEADVTVVLPNHVTTIIKSRKLKNDIHQVFAPEGSFQVSGSQAKYLPANEYQNMVDQIEHDPVSVVLHIDDPAYRFVLGGTQKVDGVDAAILAITVKDETFYWYVDPASGHILRADDVKMGANGPVKLSRLFTNWKTTNGISEPTHFVVWEGGELASTQDLRSVEYNVTVDPGIFQKPNSLVAVAQNTSLQQKLESQFTLTQPNEDRTDIVTAGSVLVLQKSGLLMYSISNPNPPQSTYKNGKISPNLGGKFLRDIGNTMANPGDIVQRNFIVGEKFWVTKIYVRDDGVVFSLFSDPYNDVRYFGELKFPIPKGSTPSPDDLLNTVAEVLTVQPNDNPDAKPQQSPGQAGAPEQPMAPITPPPPPADAPPPPPKTIALGQTKDQVVANFGTPQKIVDLGAKQIYYYPDMKVTFVSGKVTDVQ